MHCQGGGGRSPGSLSLDALFHWKADDRECERGSKHFKYVRLQIAQQARFVLCFLREDYLKKKKKKSLVKNKIPRRHLRCFRIIPSRSSSVGILSVDVRPMSSYREAKTMLFLKATSGRDEARR